MYKKILIRMGEIFTKGKNRKLFVEKLSDNIKSLANLNPIVDYDRIYVPYSDENIERLQYIFGIYSYSPVIETSSDISSIEKVIIQNIKNIHGKTFRVLVKRSWKNFPYTSEDIEKHIGSLIVNNFDGDLKVKLKNPDCKVEIEIRKGKSFVFFKRIKGLGGYPAGINGNVLHLISGGIDSPVAALELMKRGMHVDFLNFVTPPHTDDITVKKVNKLIKHLNKYQGPSKLYRSNYTDIMNLIGLTSDQSYKIILMRRSFYRIASKIALSEKYIAISNGDNLGQVASQTPESLLVISSQSELPIYRPLLTADKIETIEKARKFKTYEISIQKANESCEIFAPRIPVTKPRIIRSKRLESELTSLGKLENENIDKNIEIIEIDY